MSKLFNLWTKIKGFLKKTSSCHPPIKPQPPILDRVEGEEMKKYVYVIKLPALEKGYVVSRELKFSGYGSVEMLQPYEKTVNLDKGAKEYKVVLPYSYSIYVTLTDIDVHGQRSEPSAPLLIITEMAPRPVKPGDLEYEIIEEDSLEEIVLHTHCEDDACERIHEHCPDHVHCEFEPCAEEHDHCDTGCIEHHESITCCGGSCKCN